MMRLRQLRRRKGLSQRKLAELLGVHHTFISKLENGRTQPSLKIALKIARILEVRVEDLFPELVDRSLTS